MKKKLMLFGKCLIIFSVLWPMPFNYLLNNGIGRMIGMPYWGIDANYWWPLLVIFMGGVALCVISNYRSDNIDKIRSVKAQDTIFGLAVKVFKYGLWAIAGFYILTLLILGIYYCFFSKYAVHLLPIVVVVGVIAFLFKYGWDYYKGE